MRHLNRHAIGILLSSVWLLAQASPPNGGQSAQPKSSSLQDASEEDIKGKAKRIEVLSDTQGIDFGPYLRNHVLRSVQWNWNELMPDIARPPQSEEGTAVCEFSILKDGKIANLKIVGSSGSMPLDRAAYGSLFRSSPFPPLPKEFSRPYLALRFRFVYNQGPKKPGFSISPVEATVAIGSSVQFRADENDQTPSVSWRITGCNEDCGTISPTGLYTASSKVANPSKVTVTANLISNPDYVVQATVTVVAPRP